MDNQSTLRNFFTTQSIDRAAERRRDEEWLADRLAAESTLFVPVRDLNLFTKDLVVKPVFLSARDLQDLLPKAEAIALLGMKADIGVFAIGLPSQGVSLQQPLRNAANFSI